MKKKDKKQEKKEAKKKDKKHKEKEEKKAEKTDQKQKEGKEKKHKEGKEKKYNDSQGEKSKKEDKTHKTAPADIGIAAEPPPHTEDDDKKLIAGSNIEHSSAASKTSATAVVALGPATAQPSSVVGAAEQPPEPASSSSSKDQVSALLNGLVCPKLDAKSAEETNSKDLFLSADLVLPGIALKKMKEAMSAAGVDSAHYLGVLGCCPVTMYRKERQGVEKMIMANMARHGEEFWPLGKSDRDFSNVSTSRVNLDGEILGEPTVAIFATGKLGILKGGLLHVSDVRKILSKEDICESAMVSAQEERHLEEVQERVTVKRQRSDRSLEDVKETHISLDLKAKKLTQDLEAYTAVLGKLTSADRQEKDPSASWSCHFNDLLQQDLTDAPLLFSDSQLPYLDMIVELSKHISCLTKEKNKVEHSAARALKVFNAKCQSHQKTVNRLKRKVEKVFHGNTEETLEKNKRLHTVEKRRRQQYHAFRGHALKKHGNQRKNRKRQYKTIDNGVFTEQLRVPRRVVSIEQKLKVLDRYEEMLATKKSAAEDALEPRPRGAGREAVLAWSKKRKQAKRRMRFDSLKKLREEFPDIVGKAQPSKWKKAAESEAWRELPEFFRARSSATTNSWRRKLGLPLKGRPEGGCVPLQIQRELDTLMMEFSSGLSSVSERKELVTVEHIAETAASLISDWNSSLPDRAAMVQSFNEDLETKYKNGEMHAEAVVEAYHPLPREIAVPSMAWIRQWKASWGWSMLTRGSDDASYLPYNHVDMQMSRQRTLDLIHKKGVHKFLLLNFDQVWRNNWNMAKFKLAFKDRVNIGRKGNKAQIGPREDKKLHHIRGSRQSMTVLTSSWSDGRPGPVAFCVAEGKLRPADIQKWNAEHVGSSLIISSQTPTHFMNAESLIVVLEQLYSPAFEAQRKRYNLSAHDRGALLADAWTGTFSQAAGMNLRRHTWYERHNIEPPVVQPGGWSTHGQPVDSMHAAYRQGIRKKDLASTGHCANLRERARYETLDLKASGQVAASVKPVIDIIKISYDAWRELDRRVFIAAWMITGYFSADHFPQDTSAEQVEHMEHAKTIIDPCGLFDTCSIDPTPQMCTRYEWQIEDHFLRGGGVYHPLPYELAHAVVRTVALHGTAFLDAQQEYESCKEADPKEKLAKTKKAKEQLMGLHSADRFSVLNRRTGWVATSEWMTKHMVIVDGKPQPKVNSNTPKSKAWILAVRITIVGGNVELKLQPSEGKSFRRVRCLSLENGLEKAKLHSLAEGYAHVLDAGEDVECVDDAGSIDMEGEEASEDESVLGDEAGLEGQVKTHMENLQMDPAPTTKAGEDTQSKVWAPSSSNMMQPSVIAEAPIDPLVEGPADGEFIDESNMIQMHGHKQPGGSSHSHTPPGFFEREAYADLEKVGLTALPMADGYVLSYHKVTRQWHARDPSGSNYAPTWGLIRSELKALLLALDQLWDWYVETNPDDKVDAEEHLQNIRSYSNSIPF
ncbi:Uncharacterized protein (Fragment) [Durusdinium trenchii]|uniref:Uncharacterized protein n=1 Tax=Durusdinium trenchii TaxID=1381693 RepID=A0ABP0QVK3_9DINO